MSAEIYPAYRHSGKFGPHGPALALIAAAVIGFPLGFAYSYLIKWIPLIYFNFLATLGYGAVFGWISGVFMKFGRVRNTSVAVLSGLFAGVIGLYLDWNGHLHALFKGAPLLSTPEIIVGAMKALYAQGSWGLRHGGNITGIPLAIVWAIEGATIIGLAAFVPYSMIAHTPFCEESQCWLDEEKKISTLEPFTDPALLALLRTGDLSPLTQARPKAPGATVFGRLVLKRSPRCNIFCTVRLQNVTLHTDKDGKTQEKLQDLTQDLMLPPSMFDLIAKFENFRPAPVPAGGVSS